MQYRNVIGALSAAAILLFSLTTMSVHESVWYGGKAIGAEASGFDSLAFAIFGSATDETVAASDHCRLPCSEGC